MADLDIIKQIEKELKVELRELDEINIFNHCYTLNQNGQVTGLGLYNFKIKNHNRIISKRKDLTELSLGRNQLIDFSP